MGSQFEFHSWSTVIQRIQSVLFTKLEDIANQYATSRMRIDFLFGHLFLTFGRNISHPKKKSKIRLPGVCRGARRMFSARGLQKE